DSDAVLYAHAFALTLAGDDADAVSLWQELARRRPDVPLFAQAAAQALDAGGQPEAGKALLLEAAENAPAPANLMAVRNLLTERFFYLLSDAELDALLALVDAQPLVWDVIAQHGHDMETRGRAALLMSAGRWPVAERWLRG